MATAKPIFHVYTQHGLKGETLLLACELVYYLETIRDTVEAYLRPWPETELVAYVSTSGLEETGILIVTFRAVFKLLGEDRVGSLCIFHPVNLERLVLPTIWKLLNNEQCASTNPCVACGVPEDPTVDLEEIDSGGQDQSKTGRVQIWH